MYSLYLHTKELINKNGTSNCLEISGTSNGFADRSQSHWLPLADTKALAQVGLKPNTKNLQAEKLCLWVSECSMATNISTL